MVERRLELPRVGVLSALRGLGSMPLRDARTFVRRVEDLGFGMVWVTEFLGREALTNAALLLSSTERLKVGTGVASMWARDAVALANGARTLDEAFPGRFVVGVGVSHDVQASQRGHRYESPVRTAREYLQRLRTAEWMGPPVDGVVPTLLGALGPQMLGVASEYADGALPCCVTPAYTATARRILGLERLLVVEQVVVLDEEATRARAAGRQHLAPFLTLENYRRSFLRQGFTEADLEDGGSDRLVDAIVAWGGPEDIARRVEDHVKAGANQVAVHPSAAGVMPAVEVLETLAPLLVARGTFNAGT